MGKYFGTDGFRGEAGITLTADHAYKVGRFLGWYYNALRERNGNNEPARIVIGKDTRRSSYMFEYSLVAGLTASGADAYLLHVTTTPSVAYIARVDDFDCGIMISASHNPYYDNGIKLIDCYGEKMPEEILLLVEDYIDGKLHVFDKDWPELPFAHREHIGCTVDYVSGRNRYMGYLISLGIYSFKGVKVGLDCANGSSWNIAKSVFDALGADTYVINALSLNPIKVRKLLITAGVYESDTAKLVWQTFHSFRETQDYSTAVTSTMSALQLSRPSVTSYLPYAKGVYFPETAEAENISAGAERQRHYRAVVALKKNPCKENLWKCVVAFRGYKFKTLSGLPFTYRLKKGREDEFTKELWIDRREDSKSLAWSSVVLAYHNIGETGEVVGRPKDLGDIRGVSYIYGMFYRFGLIDVPEKVKEKMKK